MDGSAFPQHQRMPFLQAAESVKLSLNILDVVGRYVALKKRGRNFLGLCPFHQEKTPSFNVNAEKNIFKCFGCNASGDALAFLMRYENKTYGEIIRELATDQGIDILSDKGSQEQAVQQLVLEEKITTLNQLTNGFFQQQLQAPSAESVRQYLLKRGLTPEWMAHFGLGYAPSGWEHLTSYLLHPETKKQCSFLDSDPGFLVTAGLANPKQQSHTGGGAFYDKFRNRLMVPIFNAQNQIVAFGGRALAEEDQPKYLNSPETAVYVKSRILYGLNWAKESIRESKSVLLMEGYFDVIAAHMKGFRQAVATCGTAMTEFHLKQLIRHGAETLYLAFDSDPAGKQAALAAIQRIEPFLTQLPLKVKVIQVPAGKDPDDFLRSFENADEAQRAFHLLMSDAPDAVQFKLSHALNLVCPDPTVPLTLDQKADAVRHVVPILTNIPSAVMQTEYVQQVARHLQILPQDLRTEVTRYQQAHVTERSPVVHKSAISGLQGALTSNTLNLNILQKTDLQKSHPFGLRYAQAERNLLTLFFLSPDTMHYCLTQLNPLLEKASLQTPFAGQSTAAIWEALQHCQLQDEHFHKTPALWINRLNEVLKESPALQDEVANIVFMSEGFFEQSGWDKLNAPALLTKLEREIQKLMQIMQQEQRRQQSRTLNAQIRTMVASRDVHTSEHDLSILELQYQLKTQFLDSPDVKGESFE